MPRSKNRRKTAKKQSAPAFDVVVAMQRAAGLHQSGRLDAAEAIYHKVLAAMPGQTDALNLLGLAHWQKGDPARAADLLRKAVAAHPGNAGAHSNLCMVLRDLGDLDGAIRHGQQATRQAPKNAEAYYNLANALFNCGLYDDAIETYNQALALHPKHVKAHNNLGNVYRFLGRYEEALTCYAAALSAQPNHGSSLNNLGLLLKAQGDLEGAREHLNAAVLADPDNAEFRNNLAGLLNRLGLNDEAKSNFNKAMSLKPDYAGAHSNMLLDMHYEPTASQESLYAAMREWGQKHADAIQPAPMIPDSDPRRRPLTIGLVSRNFRRHPALWLSLAGLEALDRETFRLIAYADTPPAKQDDFTARLKRCCDRWVDIDHLNDANAAARMREDGVDILIDMSGHGETRLLICAYRAAPVQVKWVGGLFSTTGMQAMDWLLADEAEIPPGEERWYTERIYRLPDGYVVYDPPDYAPAVGSLPAREGNAITFGCFNNPAKLNREIISVWARILEDVPGSRLVLKGKSFETGYAVNRIRSMASAVGLDPERIEFQGQSPHQALLEAYHGIDIALDPWPYSGGLTTCEALWMGVPVLTLPGPSFAGRHSASHLSNVGLTDWIAESEEDYVTRAVAWAGDIDALADLRAGLRQQVAASPLCDGPRFARNFEQALVHMWSSFCQGAAIEAGAN